MSRLRPECGFSTATRLPDVTVLFILEQALLRRRGLIRGHLRDGSGGTCAMGAFWDDAPGSIVSTDLVDEIATVNDSLPWNARPERRLRVVLDWLKIRLKPLRPVPIAKKKTKR